MSEVNDADEPFPTFDIGQVIDKGPRSPLWKGLAWSQRRRNLSFWCGGRSRDFNPSSEEIYKE